MKRSSDSRQPGARFTRGECAAFALFGVCAASAAPLSDYAPWVTEMVFWFSVSLCAPIAAAIVLAGLPLSILLLFKRPLQLDPILRFMFAVFATFSVATLALWSWELTHGVPDSALILMNFATLLAPIALIPLWAIGKAFWCARFRDVGAAASFLSFPLVAVAVFFIGRSAGDVVATSVYGPSLATRAAHSGAPLTAHAIFGGVLGSTNYIVLDTSDNSIDDVADAFAHLTHACASSVRPIGRHYYLIQGFEGC